MSDLVTLEKAYKELVSIQKREDSRHVMVTHFNHDMRVLLDEAVAHLEGVVYYDPTPMYSERFN